MESDRNNKNQKEILKDYANSYLERLERRVDLIYNADFNNPEALELWIKVKDYDWIKPEIKEKWEKALKTKKIN